MKNNLYDLEQKCKQQEKKITEFNQILDELENDKYELEESNKELITQVQDFERDYNNAVNDHERDAALWKEKREFLEKQKQQAKQDLQDAQQKFEITIEQLQKKDSSERNKTESAQMLLISSIEKKYKDQLADLRETNAQLMRDQILKYKKLESEYNQLIQKYDSDYKGTKSEYAALENKLKELAKSEKRLISENETLKIERDRKCLEHQSALSREKDIYKQREEELENKLKEAESAKSNQLFEFEKLKAQWTFDRDRLQADLED